MLPFNGNGQCTLLSDQHDEALAVSDARINQIAFKNAASSAICTQALASAPIWICSFAHPFTQQTLFQGGALLRPATLVAGDALRHCYLPSDGPVGAPMPQLLVLALTAAYRVTEDQGFSAPSAHDPLMPDSASSAASRWRSSSIFSCLIASLRIFCCSALTAARVDSVYRI